MPNLSLVASGRFPPNPAELLGSARMQEILQEAKARFDVVLLDSPPLLAVTNAAVLSTMVDGVVLVIRTERTKRDAVRRALGHVRSVRGRLLGAVLNDVDMRSGAYYGSYGHYYYSYYGGERRSAARSANGCETAAPAGWSRAFRTAKATTACSHGLPRIRIGADWCPCIDTRDAVAVALRLALGTPRFEDARADWSVVFETASQEMLAALAWSDRGSSSGATPTAWSPRLASSGAGGADSWRTPAGACARGGHARSTAPGSRGRSQGAAVRRAAVRRSVRALLGRHRSLRGSNAACAGCGALRGLGWRSTDGVAPWHESWSSDADGSEYCLELHSFLVSDHLAHVGRRRHSWLRARVAGWSFRVHAGEFVAPYLAAHLATHQMPPLLWLVDFGALLWATMANVGAGRSQVRRGATPASTIIVTWAVRARHVGRAGGGGRLGGVRRTRHRFGGGGARCRRFDLAAHTALAASHVDRARLLGSGSSFRGACGAASHRLDSVHDRADCVPDSGR